MAALPSAIAKPFAHVQAADAQLVDLDDVQAGPPDRQAADDQSADGERADRDSTDCQGADGERADGLGFGGLGADRLGADGGRADADDRARVDGSGSSPCFFIRRLYA